MPLSPMETIVILLMITLGTVITRATPFIIFPENRRVPKIVEYLGRVLPGAMMGLLVIYCLRNISPAAYPYGLPELIAVAVVALLYLWRKNVLLSIFTGTAVYMLLVQTIFQ